jgi:hypothetical protein
MNNEINNKQAGSQDAEKQSVGSGTNGIVTVNDASNPTPAERDASIANEQDTERVRSERQSVEEGKRSSNSL